MGMAILILAASNPKHVRSRENSPVKVKGYRVCAEVGRKDILELVVVDVSRVVARTDTPKRVISNINAALKEHQRQEQPTANITVGTWPNRRC